MEKFSADQDMLWDLIAGSIMVVNVPRLHLRGKACTTMAQSQSDDP